MGALWVRRGHAMIEIHLPWNPRSGRPQISNL